MKTGARIPDRQPLSDDAPAPETAAGRSHTAQRTAGSRRTVWLRVQAVIIALLIVVGAGVALYPYAADWFSALNHTGVLRVYEGTVGGQNDAGRRRALAAAHAYNAQLVRNTFEDPFTGDGKGRNTVPTAEAKRYLSLLNPAGDGVMAEIDIPTINVDLPVYHGTAEEVLAKGAGHLYGTSLPVGGSGTHAVLTGHSGYPQATLFTHLEKLSKGDTFDIHVEGETLRYQVDQIKTVLPTDLSALQTVPGKDYVTLVTCTPIGVNTHRLLVRGTRIPYVAPPAAHTPPYPVRPSVPFPWWALGMVAALTLGWWIVANAVPPDPPRRHARDSDGKPSGMLRKENTSMQSAAQ